MSCGQLVKVIIPPTTWTSSGWVFTSTHKCKYYHPGGPVIEKVKFN